MRHCTIFLAYFQFEEQAKTLNLKCRDLEDVMCDREDELRQRKLKIDEIEAESDENSR